MFKTIKTKLGIVLVSLTLFFLNACTSKNTKEFHQSVSEVDSYINKVMDIHEIPGIALAIIKDGKIHHKNYYGKASLTFDVPVNEHHLFRVYSTTKLLVATAVFQLIEQKKLSLEDGLSSYIDNMPKQWEEVKIKHLLTHSSGIPNFIQFDSSLSNQIIWQKLHEMELDFEPGEHWQYNQTNYWLLDQIIQKVSALNLENYIIQRQFSGNGKGMLFSSNSLAIIENRISKYNYNTNEKKYYSSADSEQSRGLAGNGLNITLDKFIEWNDRLDKGEIISEKTKEKMWTPFSFTKDKRPFLFGWDDYSYKGIKSVGFTGGAVSAFRKYKDGNVTVILLTNGFRFTSVHNDIVNHVVSLVDSNLSNEEQLFNSELLNQFLSMDYEQAIIEYSKIKTQYPNKNFEPVLNRIGYVFMRNQNIDKAIEVFILNTKEYENSSNAYDSLGEAYFVNKNLKLALKNYRRALELDPNSNNAKVMIAKISSLMK